MEEGQYIYCVIGTGEARNFGPIGIGGRGDPVTTINYRELSCVVSNMPMNKYIISKETMVSHEKVIEAVMKDHTVLPVRYHTVAPNAEDIRSLLRKRYEEFRKLLRELDNKVELGLKVLWKDMSIIFRETVAENKEIKAARDRIMAHSGEDTGQDKDGLDERVKCALKKKKGQGEGNIAPASEAGLQ